MQQYNPEIIALAGRSNMTDQGRIRLNIIATQPRKNRPALYATHPRRTLENSVQILPLPRPSPPPSPDPQRPLFHTPPEPAEATSRFSSTERRLTSHLVRPYCSGQKKKWFKIPIQSRRASSRNISKATRSVYSSMQETVSVQGIAVTGTISGGKGCRQRTF